MSIFINFYIRRTVLRNYLLASNQFQLFYLILQCFPNVVHRTIFPVNQISVLLLTVTVDRVLHSFQFYLLQSCPRVGWTLDPRVGSGHDFAGFWRVGSGWVNLWILRFLLISSWYLNRYESSNTAFGLIDFLRYLIYNY